MGDADEDALAVVERDQRRPMHLPEDEAARAVDRVDHPCVARRALPPAMLFAADAVIGIRLCDLPAYHRFGRTVGDGHGVVALAASLVGDVERRAKVWKDDIARGTRGGEREFEKFCGWGRSHRRCASRA